VRISAFPVDAVDATGAGDCFDGSFLARLAAGDDPPSAARWASAAAALTTTGYGAVAPLPTAAQVSRFMQTASGRAGTVPG
jgi:2-dehydro-3-deoxygluconokinase